MTHQKTISLIGSHECTVFHLPSAPKEEAGQPFSVLIQPVDSHDLGELDKEIAFIEQHYGNNFLFAAFKIQKWNEELTPWEAPPAFGKIPFGNKAPSTLLYIEHELIPAIRRLYGLEQSQTRYYLGGYSLAGLFALWASYQSTSFHGIASASPSVWFKNWLDYAAQRSPTLQLAYLSLGDREEHTKTEIMSHVGECIRRQYELYRQSQTHCTLEWNKGNHFQDNGERTAKGFVWLLTNSHGRS